MYITITIESGGRGFDLSIDDRGSAAAAYGVLAERGMAPVGNAPPKYLSALLGEWIDSARPLAEQGIVSGDTLTAQA